MNIDLHDYIAKIPDFPKKGILFYDISTVLINAKAWQYTVNKLSKITTKLKPDFIAGIEARGFLLSSAVSVQLGIGSILIRKKGKIPGKDVVRYTYDLEYGSDTIEIKSNLLPKKSKILILDDVLATGGTAKATMHLLQQIDCELIGLACILEITNLKGRDYLPSTIPVESLLKV